MKNSISGVADGIVGAKIIDKLSDTTKSVTRIPSLGVAAEVETVTLRTSVKAIKGISKIAGPAAILTTGIDVYQDFNKYEGNDRYMASALSVGGTIVAGVIVGAVVVAGAPVWAIVGAGIAVGVGIGVGVDYIKDTLFEEKKK